LYSTAQKELKFQKHISCADKCNFTMNTIAKTGYETTINKSRKS